MLLDIIYGDLDFWTILFSLLSLAVILLLCLPIHEYAHGWMANKLGDKTALYQGRLSLNPIKHLDPIGSVMIVLFGFGWAKPVPVNPYNFKDPKKDMAMTALAGPVSNIIMAVLAILLQYILGTIFYFIGIDAAAFWFLFRYTAIINISLAIFNLIPVPPLDGSRILAAFLPDRIYYKIMQYEKYLYFIVLILLVTGFLSGPLSNAVYFVYNGIDSLIGAPFRMFLPI